MDHLNYLFTYIYIAIQLLCIDGLAILTL